MNKITRDQLKKDILANFIELIESKPGLTEDPDIKEAYQKIKDQAGDHEKSKDTQSN